MSGELSGYSRKEDPNMADGEEGHPEVNSLVVTAEVREMQHARMMGRLAWMDGDPSTIAVPQIFQQPQNITERMRAESDAGVELVRQQMRAASLEAGGLEREADESDLAEEPEPDAQSG